MHTRAYRSAVLVAAGYLMLGVWAFAAQRPPSGGGGVLASLWLASVVFAGLVWLLRPAGGHADRIPPAAVWMLPAVIGPLALVSVAAMAGTEARALVAVLWPLSSMPLGIALARRARTRRSTLVGVVLVAVGGAIVVGLALYLPLADPLLRWLLPTLQFVAVCAVVVLPGIGSLARSQQASALTSSTDAASEIQERAATIGISLLPAIAGTILVLPPDLSIALIGTVATVAAIAARLAIRPLAWAATRANAQRDLTVAVSEAERSRLAADLHDGPLQGILLLARRLDQQGDPEGAALARDIGDELRELSGDLRMPMLDDLGVGPALEWLVGRVRRVTGMDVSVAHETDGRAPPGVELAAFRIAQEAIANAVRHGVPPILVRCRTSGRALSLTIADAGTGTAPLQGGSRQVQPQNRFGLLNMQQRAEQIGARLELRRPPTGGTVVSVEWQAASV